MRLSSPRGYRTGFVALLVVVLLGAVSGPATALAYPLTVGPERFELQEVDVGAMYGCPTGTMVGVVLKDSQGFVRWSFNVGDTASYLAINGCRGAGTFAANVVGVAVPNNETALWVIQRFSCGASCAGYDVNVFSFHPSHTRASPRIPASTTT
jgi:hypothetical protein